MRRTAETSGRLEGSSRSPATGENKTAKRSMRERGKKMSLYLPGDVLADIRAEALRQQRSISWLVRNAWRLARRGMDSLPSGPQWGEDDERHPLPNH